MEKIKTEQGLFHPLTIHSPLKCGTNGLAVTLYFAGAGGLTPPPPAPAPAPAPALAASFPSRRWARGLGWRFIGSQP